MLSGKRLLLLGFIVVLLVVIPLTVYLVQQQQKLGVGAAPSTVLSFNPSTKPVAVGDVFSLDLIMTPGGNQVSFIKLTINFDPNKLTPTALGSKCAINPSYIICPNPSLFPGTPLQGPTLGTNTVSITMSVGSNQANAITSQQTIATAGFKAIADTAGSTTSISYAPAPDTQVLSIANADQFNENVLLNSQPASITIAQASATTSPSVSPSASPTGATGSTNPPPVCSSLAVDRSTTGATPYSLTFSGQGTDSNGTITKATFNFGDGTVTNVTTGGNLGTNNVNVPIAHTYNNAGSFTAKVTFTDNHGAVSSDTSACTQTITVNAAAGGANTTTQTVTVSPSASASATPTATPTPTPTPLPTPTPIAQTKGGLPATGPGDSLTSLGALGVFSTIVGLVILFGL